MLSPEYGRIYLEGVIIVKNLINDFEFDVDCPNCGKEIIFKSKDIGKSITCKSCSKSVLLEDDSSFSKGVKEVYKSFKDLEKAFKNLGK